MPKTEYFGALAWCKCLCVCVYMHACTTSETERPVF